MFLQLHSNSKSISYHKYFDDSEIPYTAFFFFFNLSMPLLIESALYLYSVNPDLGYCWDQVSFIHTHTKFFLFFPQ
jgi:hypothetical protein